MTKITYNLFDHLMSAMLFFKDGVIKSLELEGAYVRYLYDCEPDPVVWLRKVYSHNTTAHNIYIRKTFTAQTWAELYEK